MEMLFSSEQMLEIESVLGHDDAKKLLKPILDEALGKAQISEGLEIPEAISLSRLPLYSWRMVIPFELEKSLYSREEQFLAHVENQTRREKATGQPCLVGPSWKGALRHAFWELGYRTKDPLDALIVRLFGTKEEEEGRLRFESSYFMSYGRHMDQKLRAAYRDQDKPISYEVVARGEKSELRLLYCPMFDACSHREAEDDAKLVGDAVATLLRQLGVGGKASAGFGTAKDELPKKAEWTMHSSGGEVILKAFKTLTGGLSKWEGEK